LSDALRQPSLTALREILEPIGDVLSRRRPLPSALDYLPSGFFDNISIEQYLRYNFKRAGVPNDFRGMFRKTGKELYISAMNLDTAERVVFGHDEDNSVTVSEAVQASTALPGFYKPAKLGDNYYVDGGVRRTANLDVAVEHQADLVICYNPFRPFSNRVRRVTQNGTEHIEGRPLAEAGI
jgi:predicted acylesterase/phospholipase RssA